MRWNAIVLKNIYEQDGYTYPGIATVRPGNQGIEDDEFTLGVRIEESDYPSKTILEGRLNILGYLVLNADDWEDAINTIAGIDVDELIKDNKFKTTRNPMDKWESNPPIY